MTEPNLLPIRPLTVKEIEALRSTRIAKRNAVRRLLATVEVRDTEIERLRDAIDTCADYLGVLQRTFGDGSGLTYTCALCGAPPEADHREACEFTAVRARLREAAELRRFYADPKSERIDAGGTRHRKAHQANVEPDFCATCWKTWPCTTTMDWTDWVDA